MGQVLVAGGGAAGLMAALSAARAGAEVTLLEQNKQVGKKLSATGNGRCNLSNRDQDLSHYRGGRPGFAGTALKAFGLFETLDFFETLGIAVRDRKGYLYPYSDPQTGSDGSGYRLAESFGHALIKPLPALVQLRSKDPVFRGLAGLRMDARVSLYTGEQLLAADTGEVQFTDYGLSGIPVFQVSRYGVRAMDQGRKVRAVLNLLPYLKEEELPAFWKKRMELGARRRAGRLLVGLFPKKMADCLLKRAGILAVKSCGALRCVDCHLR